MRLRAIDYTSHIRGKTALKRKRRDGQHLTHPYDIVFTRGINVCDAGISDFSVQYDTLKEARYILDQLPVWVKLY